MTTLSQTRPAYRRHIFYVDKSIQRPFIVGLVLVEVALVMIAIAVAYWRLNVVIDESLYRVHITEFGPVWMRLAKEAAWILGAFAAINVLVLVVVESIGSRFERQILDDFGQLVRKTEHLDFTADEGSQNTHDILNLARAWREKERVRWVAVRRQLVELTATFSNVGQSKAQVRTAIENIRNLIA